MAVTLAYNAPTRITLSATADNSTEVILPTRGVVWVQFFDAAGTSPDAGKIATVGVDDTAIGAAYWTAGVGAAFPVPVGMAAYGVADPASIYLASAVVSAIVEVWAVRE